MLTTPLLPVRQTSPAGSSWLQSACDDGSGSLVPYWVDCRSGQVPPSDSGWKMEAERLFGWKLKGCFDGKIPGETWGIVFNDFLFTYLNFEGVH